MKKILRRLAVTASFLVVMSLFVVLTYLINHKERYELTRELVSPDGQVTRAYFSPRDDLRSLCISLIDAESQSIQFAIYTFTDKQIAQALIRAARRGVSIEGIVDRSYGQMRSSQVASLANAQIPLWVYQTAADENQAGLMHNKFWLFERSLEGKSLVWTGSYNFTRRASERNEENAVILSNPDIVKRFKDYCIQLKEKSLQISGKVARFSDEKNDRTRTLQKNECIV